MLLVISHFWKLTERARRKRGVAWPFALCQARHLTHCSRHLCRGGAVVFFKQNLRHFQLSRGIIPLDWGRKKVNIHRFSQPTLTLRRTINVWIKNNEVWSFQVDASVYASVYIVWPLPQVTLRFCAAMLSFLAHIWSSTLLCLQYQWMSNSDKTDKLLHILIMVDFLGNQKYY